MNYLQISFCFYCLFLAAVLEFFTAEILELDLVFFQQINFFLLIFFLAGNAARDNEKKRIIPRHLQLAIRNNEELNKLLDGVNIGKFFFI